MVSSCCVKGCHNRQDRETDRRFFVVPRVVSGKGKETEELTNRRRRVWIAQLQLKTLTFNTTANRFVCSDHFVNGVPAYIRDINSPNWIPTLKLGHGECKEPSENRYSRLCDRKARQNGSNSKAEAEDNGSTVQAQYEVDNPGCASAASKEFSPAPPETDEQGGTYCQTEASEGYDVTRSMLTFEEEQRMRTELNRLLVENIEMKAELAKKKMTMESLRESDDTVKYFTGIQNYVTLSALFCLLSSCMSKDKRRVLEPFQAMMLTLMHIRLHTPLKHLAFIFCISRSTASKVFHETINVMYSCLKNFIFWPDRERIQSSLPSQFLFLPWSKTVAIIDCFEIFIERPSSSDASALTWSSYKSNNTIKYLIAITPNGFISFISKGWGGRVSDKMITRESGFLDNLRPNDLVLADRGFDISDLVGMCGAEVKIPTFTRGRNQLSALEVESTRNLAHLRIHIERVIGVLCGKFTILSDVIPIEMLMTREGEEVTTLDKIVTISCAIVNMCDGIV